MAGKNIIYGNRDFHYALIDLTDPLNPVFSTPKPLYGMRGFTMEVEQAVNRVFADDVTFANLRGAKVRTAEATFTYIPDTYATDCLGFKANASGLITDTGTFENHCIFFTSTVMNADTNEETRALHILYSVQAGEPSKETATQEDETEAGEVTIAYEAKESGFVVDEDGLPTQYAYIVRDTTNATLFDTFKTEVLLPV